ncbi:NRDE family protein [Curtobacterium sp. PhB136]|uniref:NRDE family protein n=1 Tax=Curtobacterium sp. PhB136 TaxID=2485181 RepID=UPI001049FA99|nr:NRDE family protein [Curtobacterium sp. PhB136]TCK58227.1 transport and Golgi organization protein 2 [Curtobacterium sp. PhB136]
MCTVVVRVDPGSDWPITMLALRDESPTRPWDPPAAWWPERNPSFRGVRDRQAGGAWLAASDDAGLAVVLNRGEDVPSADGTWTTRGLLPLNALQGSMPGGDGSTPTTRAFNLVRATSSGASVVSWDGSGVRTTALDAGVHMVTHGEPNDSGVPRIGRWLESFRAVAAPAGPPALAPFDELRAADAGMDPGDGWSPWLGLLAQSAALPANDPDAILRDTVEPEGHFATLSIVAAAVGHGRTVLQHARLAEPGVISGSVELHSA